MFNFRGYVFKTAELIFRYHLSANNCNLGQTTDFTDKRHFHSRLCQWIKWLSLPASKNSRVNDNYHSSGRSPKEV